MTQYEEQVEKHRLKMEADEWGKGIKDLHAFNSDETSMWYDKEPDENGKRDGRVIDIRFNNGIIERTISETGEKYIIGKRMKRKELESAFSRARSSMRRYFG